MAKFIGEKSAVHIHAEGSSYHYKNSKRGDESRYNFNTNHQSQINEAFHRFLSEGWAEYPGYEACVKYFQKNLGAQ